MIRSLEESIDVLSQCGISAQAVMDAARQQKADPGKVLQMLAAYAVPGMGGPDEAEPAFIPEADELAEALDKETLAAVLCAAVPPENRAPELLGLHLPWMILLSRFGGPEGARQVGEARFHPPHNRCIPGCLTLSHSWYGISHSYAPAEAVCQQLYSGPYSSCIPDGLIIDAAGRSEFACNDVLFQARVTRSLKLRVVDARTGKTALSRGRFAAPREIWSREAYGFADLVDNTKQYLGLLKRAVSTLLHQMYLGLKADVTVGRFSQWQQDPMLMPLLDGVVFRQEGVDFMLKNGKLVRADGKVHKLAAGPVGIPHPVYIGPEALASFRQMLPKTCRPCISQLREPVYETHPVAFARTSCIGYKAEDTGRLRLTDSLDAVRIPYTWIYGEPWQQSLARQWSDEARYVLRSEDPISNHLLWLIDRQTQDERFQMDDPSVAALMELEDLQGNLRRAIDCGAVNVSAALLEAQRRMPGRAAAAECELRL